MLAIGATAAAAQERPSDLRGSTFDDPLVLTPQDGPYGAAAPDDRGSDGTLNGPLNGDRDRETDPRNQPEDVDRAAEDDLDIEPVIPRDPPPEDDLLQSEVLRGPEPEDDIDPYDPLGFRVGSLLVYPDVRVESLFTDNVFTDEFDRVSGMAWVTTPSLRITSDWSRHFFEFNGIAEYIRFPEYKSENEDNLDLNALARFDLTRATQLEVGLSYVIDSDSRNDVVVPNDVAQLPQETTITYSAGLSHRFNRLTASVRGSIDEMQFQDVPLDEGGTFENSARDETETEWGGRLSYEVKPGVALFVDGALVKAEFANPIGPDGFRRGSDGYELLFGTGLDIGSKITGEASIGYGRDTPNETRFKDIDGLLFNANLVWRATGLTTVRLFAESDIDNDIVQGSAGSLTRYVTLAVDHAFRRNIIFTVGTSYSLEEYSGISLEEKTFRAFVNAEYRFNRVVAATASYAFNEFDSTVPGADYIENEFRVGLSVRR